jgi:hypothetical protein
MREKSLDSQDVMRSKKYAVEARGLTGKTTGNKVYIKIYVRSNERLS